MSKKENAGDSCRVIFAQGFVESKMSWTYLHEGHLLAYEQTLRLLRTDQSKEAMVRDVQAKIAMHRSLRDEAERAESLLPGGLRPLQK